MANEITATVQVTVSNSNYTPGTMSVTKQITQTTVGGAQNVQTINSSATEAITKGDAINGLIYLRNMDGTNFITYGTSVGQVFKLKAGEHALVRASTGATIYAQANTAACKLFSWFINN